MRYSLQLDPHLISLQIMHFYNHLCFRKVFHKNEEIAMKIYILQWEMLEYQKVHQSAQTSQWMAAVRPQQLQLGYYMNSSVSLASRPRGMRTILNWPRDRWKAWIVDRQLWQQHSNQCPTYTPICSWTFPWPSACSQSSSFAYPGVPLLFGQIPGCSWLLIGLRRGRGLSWEGQRLQEVRRSRTSNKRRWNWANSVWI